MPPREAYRQRWQLLAPFRFESASGVSAEHVQFVISSRVPRRLVGKLLRFGLDRHAVRAPGCEAVLER